MKDYIEIKKELVPYRFNMLFGDEPYEVEASYNTAADMFVLALYKDGEMICAGEPVIYGVQLFKDVYMPDFPKINIIPYDEPKEADRASYESLNDSVFLFIDDEGDGDG